MKRIFAWYASLPNLTGQVSWEQFRHNQKGMLAGHLVLLLTDFKVCTPPLSLLYITKLQDHHRSISLIPFAHMNTLQQQHIHFTLLSLPPPQLPMGPVMDQ